MKILELEDLAERIRECRRSGKKVALCHGCFDLMHPGHIKYFKAARDMANVLAVTVTPDVYVDKGPGRPVFSQDLRAESIAALECVDWVAVNRWPTAEETLRLLRPDYYVKGQEFESLQDSTGKIQREAEVIREIGAELRFTHEIVFSSTRLLKEHAPTKASVGAGKEVLSLDALAERVAQLRARGLRVVQSHGIYDLIHPGVLQHLEEARAHGDVLVVTVVKDKDVRRGPGRPIFPEEMRARSVGALSFVDHVAVVDDEVPFECVRRIKPDFFAKGVAYKERDRLTFGKVFEEERELYFEKTRIVETGGFSFSSSSIIRNFLDIYPPETHGFLKRFGERHSFASIAERLEGLRGMKVLLVGDGIIDEYHYCRDMNRASKAHLIVNRYLEHETFAGGAFAIANHLAGICSRVDLLTLLGREDSREDFVRNNLKPNVRPTFFFRDDGPTIVKKRYINQYLNQKLFEINYLSLENIREEMEREVLTHLNTIKDRYDLVLVSDFGHGFITPQIIQAVKCFSAPLAVNTQTNGANAGYNLITKYHRPNFVCLDEPEVRLAAQERTAEIEDVARKIARQVSAECLIVTLGKQGSIAINDRNDVNRTPIFSTRVVDTVGAGDAFFAFTAPCFAAGLSLELISFIGNSVGALAVQIVGNKKPVEKHELLDFICALLK